MTKGIAERIELWRSRLTCSTCGQPATCFGAYESHDNPPQPSCSDCCAHGNEDGWCKPIAEAMLNDFVAADHLEAVQTPQEEAMRLYSGRISELVGDLLKAHAEIDRLKSGSAVQTPPTEVKHKPAWQRERGDGSIPCAHDCPACGRYQR